MANSSKCVICGESATKKVLWADGRAYQPSCDAHVRDTQLMLTKKNGKMTELAGVRDFSVPSTAYPSLERKPGGPDNWVEKAGGLPSYIERIAKHLHYEKGMTISHAIATAVNTVRRWALGGTVAKYGSKEHVSPQTVALAQKAWAEWNAKKGSADLTQSAILAQDTLDFMEATVDLTALAARANGISDPIARGEARAKIFDLATLTKDGRKSFKGSGGSYKHGFIPLDTKAKVAKAKGSPVAMQRMNRLFGKSQTGSGIRTGGLNKEGGGAEAVKSVGQALRARIRDASKTQKAVVPNVANRAPVTKRSEQPWESIPDTDKTIRNGKKYVLTTFGGKQTLTEYAGPNNSTMETTDPAKRLYRSVTAGELSKLTSGQLRKLLEVPGQPDEVKTKINQMIATKQSKERETA